MTERLAEQEATRRLVDTEAGRWAALGELEDALQRPLAQPLDAPPTTIPTTPPTGKLATPPALQASSRARTPTP